MGEKLGQGVYLSSSKLQLQGILHRNLSQSLRNECRVLTRFNVAEERYPHSASRIRHLSLRTHIAETRIEGEKSQSPPHNLSLHTSLCSHNLLRFARAASK